MTLVVLCLAAFTIAFPDPIPFADPEPEADPRRYGGRGGGGRYRGYGRGGYGRYRG